MQVAFLELILTELGILSQPLQESYVQNRKWIANTWLKSIWEKVDKFKIMVEIAPLPVSPPREGDKWFVQAVMEAGVTNPKEQRILNQFRCYQQVLYVLDVLDTGGKCIDKRIPGLPPVRQNLVDSCLSPRKTSQQISTALASGALLHHPLRLDEKQDWEFYCQRPQDMGLVIN
jgi:hypothetical protein